MKAKDVFFNIISNFKPNCHIYDHKNGDEKELYYIFMY